MVVRLHSIIDSAVYTESRSGNRILRSFEPDTVCEEYTWHRDRRDRTVTVCEGRGWQLQLDNQLPVSLTEGTTVHIPAGVYHRVWPGTNTLSVQITEH